MRYFPPPNQGGGGDYIYEGWMQTQISPVETITWNDIAQRVGNSLEGRPNVDLLTIQVYQDDLEDNQFPLFVCIKLNSNFNWQTTPLCYVDESSGVEFVGIDSNSKNDDFAIKYHNSGVYTIRIAYTARKLR